jgi:hypothetical protein
VSCVFCRVVFVLKESQGAGMFQECSADNLTSPSSVCVSGRETYIYDEPRVKDCSGKHACAGGGWGGLVTESLTRSGGAAWWQKGHAMTLIMRGGLEGHKLSHADDCTTLPNSATFNPFRVGREFAV